MKTLFVPINLFLVASTALTYATTVGASAQETETIIDAISSGTAYLDERFRVEHVTDDSKLFNGTAATLRSKLGYKTAAYKGFSGTIEFEHSAEIFGGDYNNGINGKTAYPAIIDANHTEVNQAFLAFTGIEKTTIAAGRQAMNLGNQRFVGTVGWRQNDQTFDAAAIINNSIDDLTVVYSYVWNVNRIFGNDHPSGDLKTKTNIVNASYKGIKGFTIEAYGLLIDLDAIGVKALNSKTFGARLSGSQDIAEGTKVLYSAEYANQTDYKANPFSYSADYYNVEAGVAVNGFTIKAGIETLGSDEGATSFTTPLATLHKFNGWADKFLNTPANGLRDFYGQASYAVADTGTEIDGTNITVIYHKFKSDFGDIDYGSEIDVSVSKKIFKQFTILLKYANYNADTWSSDTSKFWFQVATRF